MRRGLTRHMVIASCLLAFLVGAAFVVLLFSVDDLRDTTGLTRRTQEQLTAADQLEKLVLDLETGVRGYVITREAGFLEPWSEARAALPTQTRNLQGLVAGDPGSVRRVRQIVRDITSYIQDYARPLVSAVRRDDASARSVQVTAEGKRRIDGLRAQFESFQTTERALLSARQDRADRGARRASVAAGVSVAGSIILIVLFSGYLTRLIVRPLRRAARMADQIAGGDLSARMREDDVGEIGALGRSFNAMAGSLEASESDLRRIVGEQSALRRVATLVARSVPPAEVVEAVTREVGLLSGADLARMERYETDGTVTGLAGWSRDEGELAVGTRIELEGVSIAALVLQTGRPVRVDSFVDASGPIAEEARALGIQSSVGCPIVVAGRLWGVIAASSRGAAPFPENTESRIGEFTELVATAVANAESRAQLSRLADEQSALRRVATLVARRADLVTIFTAAVEEVQRLFGADAGAVTRFEPNGASIVAASTTAVGAFRPGTRWAPDDVQATAEVFRTWIPTRLDDDVERTAGGAVGTHAIVAGPITVGDRLWGAIVVQARPDRLPVDVEERIVSFTELVATAIADAESRAALAASRARIVATADETRRRIERDLHDGTQQRLVSLGLELRIARAAVPPDLPELEEAIGRVAEGLAGAVDDLREIARGIHPAILGEGGLAPALRTLARRSAIPVEVDVRLEARLPQETEVAAYYVVSEALTNTTKHAHALRATVAVDERDGRLHISIRDDGIGGADSTEGSGLIGLRDRVEALGGSIEVTSPAGQGTLIEAELPLGPPADGPDAAREAQSESAASS